MMKVNKVLNPTLIVVKLQIKKARRNQKNKMPLQQKKLKKTIGRRMMRKIRIKKKDKINKRKEKR